MKRMTTGAMAALIDTFADGEHVRATFSDSTVVEGPVYRSGDRMFVGEWAAAFIRLSTDQRVPSALCHIERV